MLLIAVYYRRHGRNLRAKLYMTAINSLPASANHAYLKALYACKRTARKWLRRRSGHLTLQIWIPWRYFANKYMDGWISRLESDAWSVFESVIRTPKLRSVLVICIARCYAKRGTSPRLVSVRLSCPSVRQYVTLVYCIETAKDIVRLSARPGSAIVLVFLWVQAPLDNSKKHPSAGH